MRSIALDDLTEGRFLYERRPPALGFIVIAAVLVTLAVTLGWAAVTRKPYIVVGMGAVESSNRTQIMSSVSGMVLDVATPNGAQVGEGDTMIEIQSVEHAAEEQSLGAQIAALESALALQRRYTTALQELRNDFDRANPVESSFYYSYEAFRSQRAQLRIDSASMLAIGYTQVEIDNAIRGNRLKVAEMDNTALSASEQRAAEILAEINTLRIRGSAVATSGSTSHVVAAASGKVYLDPSIKPGTVVSAGSPLGTISSRDGGFDVRVFIAVPDRELVDVGDEVTVSVSGLPSVEYGKIEGVVAAIDSDVTLVSTGTPGAENAVFGMTLELDEYFVTSRDGARHELGNGTVVRAELVYDETTYLEYLSGLVGFAA